MKTVFKASLVLVGGVTLINLLMLGTGLHESFALGQVVFLLGAIALNIGVVYWALEKDAATHGYLAQLLTALAIGLLAGFAIVLVSWFLIGVAFPNALDEMRQGATSHLQSQELTTNEYHRQLELIESTTPLSQALPGGPGTLLTSLIAGAVIAFFKRRR